MTKKKKKPTKKEIDKITKSISNRGSLVHFLFITALTLGDEKPDKIATTLMSIYTMGHINGLGYNEDEVVGMMREEDEEVN